MDNLSAYNSLPLFFDKNFTQKYCATRKLTEHDKIIPI